MTALAIHPAGTEAAAVLAALHEAAFAPADRWGVGAIALLLDLPGHFGLLATIADVPVGFAMARAVAGEAEVLTLAVLPAARRAGAGAALMRALAAGAARLGADALFLEVAESNAAARALYAGLGAAQVGRRRAYYPDGGDALVLRLPLMPPDAAAGG